MVYPTKKKPKGKKKAPNMSKEMPMMSEKEHQKMMQKKKMGKKKC